MATYLTHCTLSWWLCSVVEPERGVWMTGQYSAVSQHCNGIMQSCSQYISLLEMLHHSGASVCVSSKVHLICPYVVPTLADTGSGVATPGPIRVQAPGKFLNVLVNYAKSTYLNRNSTAVYRIVMQNKTANADFQLLCLLTLIVNTSTRCKLRCLKAGIKVHLICDST